MTHEEARMKVCAVCTNLWGYKAARKVTPEEEKLIQQDVLEVYTSCNMFFPSGICVRCIHLLIQVKRTRGGTGMWSSNCQRTIFASQPERQDPQMERFAAVGGVNLLG